jgi:hypothetical protein
MAGTGGGYGFEPITEIGNAQKMLLLGVIPRGRGRVSRISRRSPHGKHIVAAKSGTGYSSTNRNWWFKRLARCPA